jgi:hypothetical protein
MADLRTQDRTSRPTITEVSRPARPAPVRPLEAPPMPMPERLPRSVPRSAPAPLAETQPTGVPWLLQALLLISVCMSILVCSPVGGLIGQVSSQITIAHSAALLQGESVALALAARNADALASGTDARLDMSLVAGTPGVRDARVTDARGMVLAPADKARLDMSHYAAFARAMGSGDAASAPTATGTTEIVVPVHTTASGPIVGYAWIEYDDDPVAASLVNPWIGAFASLLVAGTVGGLLVVGIWWLAMRPAQRLALSAERLASGRTDRVRSPARLDTWEQLARSLNELGARARQRGED